jgi:DNA-binding transcriptional ArsR family regulator
MIDSPDELEAVVFQALAHRVRRTILKIVGANPQGVSYTELITELGLSTGKLNYHLEQLEGLIMKNLEHRYALTSLGQKAAKQMKLVESEFSSEDQKYLRLAERAQKTSLEPTLKVFILVGIFGGVIILGVLLSLAYIAITQVETPTIVYILLPLLIALDLLLTATLVRALQKIPIWLRRLERRFFE